MKIKKYFIFILFLTTLNINAMNSSVKNGCLQLTKEFKELQNQLPIHSDIMTTIVGMSSFYISGENRCYTTFTSIIHINKFIKSVSTNKEKEKFMSIYLKTTEGKNEFVNMINKKFNRKIQENGFPTKSKGFTFKEIYSFSDYDMKTITLEHSY